MQDVGGLLGGSGHPQRLPSRMRTVRLPVVARTLAVAIKKPISRSTQSPASTLDMVRVKHYLPGEKFGRMAKMFPKVCKPDVRTPASRAPTASLPAQRERRGVADKYKY